jgi:hypothetical protein
MITAFGLVLATFVGGNFAENTVARERVDLIELNHFIDDTGRHVFDQLIFYDWSDEHGRYHVRAWRLIKSPSQFPTRHWQPACYRCVWHDDGVLREVWAETFRETWSQQDPERANRKIFPEDQRTELRQPRLVRETRSRRG